MDSRQWTRRDLLRGMGVVGLGSLAGCSGLLEEQSTNRNPSVVENRPDAIYRPSHVEGMEMIGMREAGGRMVGLMYAYAHRFWTVTGTVTELVPPGGDVHLMASVWDPDTGTVLPVGTGLSVEIRTDGERLHRRSPWTMLSQNMGFHYGDNFALDGDGTYTVTVQTGSVGVDRVGGFADRFGESATAEFEWEYSAAARNEIAFQTLEDAGDRGALAPMEMDMMPLSFAPSADDLPGQVLGTAEAGDVHFAATVVDGDEGDVLAVSPRTRYNGYVLPAMSLSATLSRGGSTAFDDILTQAVGPDLGYHYRASVDAVESGDELTITTDSGPQVSRHEGYETAFTGVPDVSITAE
ncbi:Fe2+ transport protein [Halomicrobium zhouii]|uniref:Fe2+ transport protein n=2 Tax=Halomicrobium zhouii TaxID=767519 RepID=A0A1I6MAK0_9EURY|nr:Fe2+ transport protein [Halomicrobium zhouii]